MTAPTTEPLWWVDARDSDSAWWVLTDELRDQVRTWMRSEGINPDDTAMFAVYLVDMPYAVAIHYVLDGDGWAMLTEDGDEVRTYTATYPLSGLPPWVRA